MSMSAADMTLFSDSSVNAELSPSIQALAENLIVLTSTNPASILFTNCDDDFSCFQCCQLLHHPVTAPCGHSFCSNCAKRTIRCNRCDKKHNPSSFSKLNVVLDAILERWYPEQYIVQVLTEEGDRLLEKGSLIAAEEKFTEALEKSPYNTYSLYRRALARKGSGDWQNALRDVLSAKIRSNFIPKSFRESGNFSTIASHEDYVIQKALKFFVEFASTLSDPSTKNDPQPRCDDAMDDDEAEQRVCSASQEADLEQLEEMSELESQTLTENNAYTRINRKTMAEVGEKLDNIIARNMSDSLDPFTSEGRSSSAKHTATSMSKSSEDLDEWDFYCILCTAPFFDPVCTPCGHTFCLDCLERCFDHGTACPMCKTSLSNIYQYQKCHLPMDRSVDAIIRKYLPKMSAEREELRRKEWGSLRETLPVFVCTVAMPTVKCFLHVFEPRYRLMIRRAIRVHGGIFGITIGSDTAPFHNVGTIVSIENVSFFQDGRSLVTIVGTRRFEVEEYSTRDGYNTAKTKYIVDEEEENIEETEPVVNEVYQKAKDWWFKRTSERFKYGIKKQYGDFPELDETKGDDGPNWPWWVLATLPVKADTKAYVLAKNNLRARLVIMKLILQKLDKDSA